MASAEPRIDPLTLVRSIRATYSDLRRRGTGFGDHRALPEPFARMRLATPAERPIDEDALPEPARALIDEYRAEHPDLDVVWERRMRADEAGPTLVVEDDRELPGEHELISVGITVTLTTSDSARVLTDVLVGRRQRP
jgi:hypothetical protein